MEYIKVKNNYVIRLNKNDEVVSSIKEVCENENITLGSISGIGAVNFVEAGLFDTEKKEYHSNKFEEDMEIVSLSGNISTMNNEVYLHFHICIADKNGNAFGGHLNKALISATGEIIIHQIEAKINREFNEAVGLNLMKFN